MKKVEYESETSVINYTSESNDTSFEASTTDLLIIIIFIQNRHHRYLKNDIEILCYYYETLATADYFINTKEAP